MSTAVTVTELTVERGGREILQNLSCQMARGRITRLFGPSGAGKSTLIRCIVGVQKVVSGSITVLDEPAGSARNRRRVGYVTQAPSIYTDLTVIENARYFAALVGLGSDAARSAVEEVGL